jgi:hypothetical protein
MENSKTIRLLVTVDIKVKDFYYVSKYGVYQGWLFKVHLNKDQKQQVVSMVNQKYPNGYPISDFVNANREIDKIVAETVVQNTCGYCSVFGHTIDPDSPEGFPAKCPNLPQDYIELVERLHKKYGLEKWFISSLILKRVGGARPLPGCHEHIVWNAESLEDIIKKIVSTKNNMLESGMLKAKL